MSEWVVSKDEEHLNLGQFLKEKMGLSGKQAKRFIDQGLVDISGIVERFASTPLKAGEKVHCSAGEKLMPSLQFPVLFETASLLIIDKPAGVNCDESLIKRFPGCFLVHRLDRYTTGALLLAKSSYEKEKLERLFRERLVKKEYLAVVDGKLKAERGVIQNYLGKKALFAGQTIWGEVAKEKGAFAETLFERVAFSESASLVKLFPLTGRTHQIRVHMAGLGHPLLGDTQYGKSFVSSSRPPYYLLHAERLSFEGIEVKAPLPKLFLTFLEDLLLV